MSDRLTSQLREEIRMPQRDISQPSHSNHPLWKLHRRLAWLKHLGALGPKELHLDHDGLPCFDGMASEHGDFPVPPLDLPDPPIEGPAGLGNYPSVTSGWLSSMIFTLNGRGKLTHVAWKKALDKLQKLLLLPEEPSAFIPLKILSVAKKACDADDNRLRGFVHRAEANHRLLLAKHNPVGTWSAQCMSRMIGFEASHEGDMQWWLHSTAKPDIMSFDDDAYVRIDYAWFRFYLCHSRYHRLNDMEKGREEALKGLHHMKTFVHLHQNGQVLAQVENHIKDLQDFIQAKGLGEHLLPS